MATTEHTGILKYVDDDGNVNILYPEIGKELTKAEYDALSEEERKTGVYFLTDVDSLNGESSTTNALTPDDVVDNLESTETKLPLSANQGKILADQLGGFSLVKISQTAYDALTTKDEHTIYFTYDE